MLFYFFSPFFFFAYFLSFEPMELGNTSKPYEAYLNAVKNFLKRL